MATQFLPACTKCARCVAHLCHIVDAMLGRSRSCICQGKGIDCLRGCSCSELHVRERLMVKMRISEQVQELEADQVHWWSLALQQD